MRGDCVFALTTLAGFVDGVVGGYVVPRYVALCCSSYVVVVVIASAASAVGAVGATLCAWDRNDLPPLVVALLGEDCGWRSLCLMSCD